MTFERYPANMILHFTANKVFYSYHVTVRGVANIPFFEVFVQLGISGNSFQFLYKLNQLPFYLRVL